MHGATRQKRKQKVAKGFIDQEQHLKATQTEPHWLRTVPVGTKTTEFSIHKMQKLIESGGKFTQKAKSSKSDHSKTQIKHIYRNICFHIKIQIRDKFSTKMP